MELVFAIDFTIITIAFVCYILFVIQQDYCNGIMYRYNELINNISGKFERLKNETPVRGIVNSEIEPGYGKTTFPETSENTGVKIVI